jgi:cell wall-associated NlpC family hydrolase
MTYTGCGKGVHMHIKSSKRFIREALSALLAVTILITALSGAACRRGDGYRILTDDEIREATANNAYSSDIRRTVTEAALSLVGEVGYFWGGKSYCLGRDANWGTPREVTSPGHRTTGETIPFGLDCSGFVSWCFMQTGGDTAWMLENVGDGTWNQWQKSQPIDKSELQSGDIVFTKEYPGAKSNHVGIVVGFLKDGEPLIAHCSPGENGVVVSTCADTFRYFRSYGFLNGD